MPKRYTVRDLAERFVTTDKTIRRWIDEGKDIIDPFTKEKFIPGKDPGGNWLFVIAVITVPAQTDEIPGKPASATRLRRRVLSPGVK